MRVPVYPNDLIRNRGFKSLAKQLQKQWCGPSPITLANAQEVLAQGLGYQNFHDLEKASKICPTDEPVPPEAIVRRAIRSAIRATLQPEVGLHADQLKLKPLVKDLLLTNLVAFKRVQASPDPGRDPLLKLVSRAQLGLTREQVQTLEKILSESGGLRDRALFACMQGALRPSEYLSARMRGNAAVYSVKSLDTQKVHEAIPESHRVIFDHYLKASKLSDGEYLFHAANAPELPLSSDTLRRICVSWARKANINVSLLTPHSIHKTTDDYADLMHQMSQRMGHNKAIMSLAYVAGRLTTRM
ncbi:hypothetical protein [Pseudomonas gessardii]|uniref:hypothetical protein n=1 Tax=Pseudomonas gessardii TaxID=78544 RepID=UPI001474FE55|nr:hypothetical protein [Pseudomonas gessardii]NNA70427.1 hypothetical protein [Pseudomonas gessardii]